MVSTYENNQSIPCIIELPAISITEVFCKFNIELVECWKIDSGIRMRSFNDVIINFN